MQECSARSNGHGCNHEAAIGRGDSGYLNDFLHRTLIVSGLWNVVARVLCSSLGHTMENQPEDCQDWLESCINEDKSGSRGDNSLDLNQLDFDNEGIDCNKSPEERKGTYTRLRSASKPHSTPQTLKWLDDNYEIAEGVCIPRSTLYVHYLDYCEKNDTQPVNAASFGKIIRQQFPQLTTRRLGTRGQSKYHYYGIGIRESSVYYETTFSAKGSQGGVDGRKENVKQIIAYSPRSKLGMLLPEFPDVKEIQLPPNVEEGKVFTFLMMYRTHCQRILDTVIRANFDEVQSFLLHFWQGMPSHIKSILENKVLVTLVGVCDSILYKAIANVLMPTVIQPLPESLTQVIRKFSVQLDDWLKQALDTLPEGLQTVKFDLARCFSQVLKRQTSLNHLCQAARTVIHSAEITSQMLDDWINVDLNSIIKQTLYTMDNYADTNYNAIFKLTHDFELLLDEQSPLESYIDWLDKMVDQCVVQKSQREPGNMKRIARQFLLMWSCFGTRVIRDMTLHSAPSFGSYHLLHLMFDEYVLYTVEHLYNQDKGHQLYRAAKGEISLDIVDELLRADPHPGRSRYSGSPHTEDRTSVIRGPDCTLTHSSNTKPLSHFDENFQMASSYPSLQPMSLYEGNKQNRSPQSNNFMPWNESHPSTSKTTFSSPVTYSASMSSSCVPETFTGCSNPADNNYDWYDWTEGMCNNNVTSALVPNFGLMSRNQNADQRSRNISANNNFYSQSDLNDLNMNYDQQFRRKYVDLPPLKRKHSDDLQDGVLRPQTSEYYQHNITNLI